MSDARQTAATTGRLCLSVSEAAALIGVSPRQIYTLAHKAGLPTIRLGGRRLIRADDLRRWLEAQPVDRPGADGAKGAHP